MDQDLIDLIASWRGGEIDPARAEQILARLRRDEAFQDEFVAELGMLARLKAVQSTEPRWLRLQDELGLGPAEGSSPRDPDDEIMRHLHAIRLRRRVGRGKWALGGAAAAAACVVALVYALGAIAAARWLARPRPPGPAPAVAAAGGAAPAGRPAETFVSGGVAVLTRAVNVLWDPAGPAPGVGAPLAAGPLRFRSGIIQLEFYSGATVILEGPAEIDLKASDRAYCRRGKLRALVPSQARGFGIDSPAAGLVDLGTEFGMEVGQDRAAAVYVFDGKVEIHGPGRVSQPASKRELTEGHGVRIGAAGDVTGIAADPGAFPTFQDLERRDAEELKKRYGEWLAGSRRWQDDSRVVAYFPFEARPAGRRALADLGPRPDLDGAIVGCDWVEGRWPGKGALEFKRPSDRVRINVPGAFESLTMMAWVRVDALPQWLSALMLADASDPCEPHWQINQKGEVSLGVRQEAVDRWNNYIAPPVFVPERLGRWTHLAVVYDGPSREIIHYVDGVAVSCHAIINLVRLRIGEAELGNWGSPPRATPPRSATCTGGWTSSSCSTPPSSLARLTRSTPAARSGRDPPPRRRAPGPAVPSPASLSPPHWSDEAIRSGNVHPGVAGSKEESS